MSVDGWMRWVHLLRTDSISPRHNRYQELLIGSILSSPLRQSTTNGTFAPTHTFIHTKHSAYIHGTRLANLGVLALLLKNLYTILRLKANHKILKESDINCPSFRMTDRYNRAIVIVRFRIPF